MSEWQPIETAPKDENGPDILIAVKGEPEAYKAFWSEPSGKWWIEGGQTTLDYPTHWMPIPVPPKDPKQP